MLAAGGLLTASALILPGCSGPSPGPSASTSAAPPVVSPEVRPEAPPPAAEALTEVIYRLADPTVPGADKVPLVEDAIPADAARLERFAIALRDGGFAPLNVTATGITPGARPGEVVATIEVARAEPGDGFSFPMGFRPTGGGWQLTRETAEMLLTAP